ncbi:uridine phosphorylase [Thalassotalea sp. HSM 43]|uniref:uridine phosphorylase n=1 Tax=Thalassotalea sp. HSM 43 TaxID=2552945 RepID=UPI0010803DF4|nr:uridine phosphorylase [Thalassotalea sp. HSM 43]QBY05927.1 uridine phosphorylase [Thalassotalea sp. HSM 43]
MSDAVFHLGVNKEDIDSAVLAILPGDPNRVERIAEYLDNPKFLISQREYTLYTGTIDGHQVVICSTGIGGPSTSIAVEELAQIGVRYFLRIGTTGAIQPDINVGDIIVTTGSVRLDGASLHFAPMEFPAVADFQISHAMVNAAKEQDCGVYTGVTASSDTFYPGQERYDTYTGRVVRRFVGSAKEWQDMGVLNFEMESATLLTMCASSGLQAGCLAGVIVNRHKSETPNAETHKLVESRSIKAVIRAAQLLLADIN